MKVNVRSVDLYRFNLHSLLDFKESVPIVALPSHLGWVYMKRKENGEKKLISEMNEI